MPANDTALVRKIRRELRQCIKLVCGNGKLTDRGRGQLEALRHMQTVLEIDDLDRRREQRRKAR
jgi:hypothetical protein